MRLSGMLFSAMVFGVVMMARPAVAAQTYTVDTVHSTVGFSIAHIVVSTTTGTFDDYQSDCVFSADDLANSKFDFVVKAAGINTKNEARDKHLRGADFFDAEKFPTITFKTKKIVADGELKYKVTGDLTMKDVTKEIEVPVTVSGPIKNPMGGGEVLGLASEFQINRQDYHVSWNKTLDQGGLMIGDIVTLRINLEAHSQ